MYATRLKYRSQQLGCFLQRSYSLFQSTKRDISQPCYKNSTFSSSKTVTNEFCLTPVCLPSCRRHPTCLLYRTLRFYSSKGDESNASEDKHVPVKDTTHFERGASRHEEVVADSKQIDDYSRFRNLEEQEWLDFEKLSIDAKKNESPFLTKRERFKNEFLRRVIPWKKIAISWETFPYFIDEHVKKLLNECAASHLKHKKFASTYGARLSSSSSRILLRSIPGTELYRERLVRALARDLQVPLLVLDSIVLAPYDFSQQYASESETDDENEESGEECTSESEAENENDASNEEDDSDDIDAIDVKASTKALKKLVVPASLEEFAKRVSGEVEDASSKGQSETIEASQQAKRPLKKGDRVKYVGASVHAEIDNRIILGKIPTSDGSTNAYTFISGRPLSSGQRGEVYEINGDQVAVILDSSGNKQEEENKDEKLKEQISKPPIYWIDSQDIVHDLDTQAEDWYMAMEALCEVLPSLQPIIVYFPDCSEWLSRAVPKSKRKEFIHKLEEMFDQLSGPVVLICGQNKQDNGSKEKKKCTMVLPNLGHLAGLPVPLRQLTEGLTASLSSKDDEIYELFTNTIFISPPKEEATLRIFNKHIEEDRRIIISRNNLIQLHKVLQEHELSCLELLHVKTDGVILTMQKAEMVVGWARNHYLSSSISPSVKGNRLMIPRESLEIAISRLKGQEEVSTKPSQSLKSLAKDEYEASFVSAVVSPEEIGVKFDDIGALEDAKRTLRELVTLPMKRPELFSHGNLLRPCKGILLFGPPGTGKTLLAKALATEAGANFLCITGSTITSKWFGDGEKLAKALFSFASKLAPVIIFIDEIDSLLGARGGGYEHEATRRIRNEFMAAWDGLQTKDSQRILVLGATNRPFDLDDAVIRRLPRRVYIDLPDAANRRKILKILLSQENLDPNFKFNELANVTEGYSGSDLKNLCIAAAFRPVEELLEKEEKDGRITSSTPSLRLLDLNDFLLAKSKVGASVAHDSTSMSELRRWNEEYGEGGKRIKSPFGFGD